MRSITPLPPIPQPIIDNITRFIEEVSNRYEKKDAAKQLLKAHDNAIADLKRLPPRGYRDTYGKPFYVDELRYVAQNLHTLSPTEAREKLLQSKHQYSYFIELMRKRGQI